MMYQTRISNFPKESTEYAFFILYSKFFRLVDRFRVTSCYSEPDITWRLLTRLNQAH